MLSAIDKRYKSFISLIADSASVYPLIILHLAWMSSNRLTIACNPILPRNFGRKATSLSSRVGHQIHKSPLPPFQWFPWGWSIFYQGGRISKYLCRVLLSSSVSDSIHFCLYLLIWNTDICRTGSYELLDEILTGLETPPHLLCKSRKEGDLSIGNCKYNLCHTLFLFLH